MVACHGKNTILLGLSHRNLDLLKEGKPIQFTGERVGLSDDIRVVIFSGETEERMVQELRDAGVISPDAQIKGD